MSNPTLKYRRYINYIYDISGIIGSSALSVGNNSGITPLSTLDVSGTANITGNLSVDANALFVDASNNRVGIGTTTPSEKLNINSGNLLMNGSFDGLLMNPGSGAGSLAITRAGNFINNVQQINSPYTDNVGSTSGGGAQISLLKDEMTFSTFPNTGALGTPITLTERMRIKSTGVGIGTSTPQNSLDVRGITRITNNDGASMFYVNWVNSTGNSPTILNALIGSGGGYGELQTRGSIQTFYTTTTERMRITDTGNVGINTTTPTYRLHVEGSGTANEVVGWFNNQGAFSSSIAVRQSAKTAYITNHSGLGTPNYDGQLSNAISYGVSSGASPIQFWNGNTGVGSRGTAKMTILENGNTGIGTNAPAYPLDVSGSAKFTTIRDGTESAGSAGQVLSSTGSALSWIAPSSLTVGTATNSIITNDVTDVECFIPFVNSTPNGTAQHLKGNSALTYSAALGQLGVPRIKPVTIRDATESAGSAGQVLSSTGSALSWISPLSSTLGYAIIRHIVSSGSGPGVFFTISPTPTRTTRTLNTLVAADNNLGVTLAANAVTIPTAGTYVFRARASFSWSQLSGTLQYARVSSKLMIALTSGTPDPNWIVGESYVGGFNPTALSQFSPSYWLECNGVKTVTANTSITLTQICRGLDIITLNVLGGASTFVDSIPELYATVEIQRIA